MTNISHDLIKIRKAILTDLPIMIKLLADDELGKTREHCTEVPSDKYLIAFEKIINDNNNHLMVMEYEDQVIGVLQLTIIQTLSHQGGIRAEVQGVRIASSYRNHGFGNIFFKWVIAKAKELNCTLLQLTTDKKRPQALNFYKKIGFINSHEGLKLYL